MPLRLASALASALCENTIFIQFPTSARPTFVTLIIFGLAATGEDLRLAADADEGVLARMSTAFSLVGSSITLPDDATLPRLLKSICGIDSEASLPYLEHRVRPS